MIDFLKGVMVLDNSIFATEKIGKLLFRFSVPCITSLLISALYNIIDQIFVGNAVGYLGNAATGVVFPILLITMAFSWAYGDGTAAYMSLCQGRSFSSYYWSLLSSQDVRVPPFWSPNCV